jgi:hypothetical protein
MDPLHGDRLCVDPDQFAEAVAWLARQTNAGATAEDRLHAATLLLEVAFLMKLGDPPADPEAELDALAERVAALEARMK